ncbi:hypothetical protein GCM10022212_29300 [Actimicrobium antarcticum]|uniref:TadE-like domain-containing protein n=2 Tax=Actimicrobium antarcticum TaxID=1051899 RepID=A0ABP7TR90_9BURK
MVEFVVAGSLISLMGLAILQYGMLFFARNQMNHAAFMAARAGSMQHADLAAVRTAYTAALMPMYGGGTAAAQRSAPADKARTDVNANVRITLRNPTTESFADGKSDALQSTNPNGKRVIPNSGQSYKTPS